ncbi:MAG: DNA polymerase III subunit gamma/tau [Bacteriovoracaceae bacterium]|jgi:DNA polymerase III subunit gamma/tau|nr:DNA polymerase III subunit gamma/tau [Bacteriovoracaceae bacterium]
MEYQVLARKWRPKTFEDVIGQKHITNSLQNAIAQNKIGHAYILTGTRGIGKTSVARLFAKALRCEQRTDHAESCGHCDGCLDFDSGTSMNVLEFDGASNNSVDDMRELINNVHYLPTSGKYKIYIVDEVHMLSISAFNALLKTLEEPPEHVIFIFATTEPQKLLGTVLSRCQKFEFRNASQHELVAHLQKISEVEGIVTENAKVFNQIAKLGSGSVRDTLSLLDQVLSFAPDKKITETVLAESLGLAKTSSISKLVTELLIGDVKAVSNNFRKMIQENIQLKNIVLSMLDFIFDAIENIDDDSYLSNELELDVKILSTISTPELMWIFENIGKEAKWILESIDPTKLFEIQIQKLAMRREIINFEYGVVAKSQKKKPTIAKPEQFEGIENEIARDQALDPCVNIRKEIKLKKAISWEEALSLMKDKSPATASYLERSNLVSPIEILDEKIKVDLGVPFHEKIIFDHLQEDESKSKVTDLLRDVFEREVFLTIGLLKQEEIDRTQFRTKVEIIEEAEEKKKQIKKDNLKNNPLIKKAEQLFNTKIDKIKLNSK